VFLGGLVGRPPATLEKRIPINKIEIHEAEIRRLADVKGNGVASSVARRLGGESS
jgi:hypothetical protein